MNQLVIVENASTANPTPILPTAAWDLVSFFTNAKSYVTVLGGGFITLVGLIVLIVAVVFVAKKFLSGQQAGPGESWVKIVIMILVGGALMTGGIVLLTTLASGGQKTVTDLGGGFIVFQSILGLVR